MHYDMKAKIIKAAAAALAAFLLVAISAKETYASAGAGSFLEGTTEVTSVDATAQTSQAAESKSQGQTQETVRSSTQSNTQNNTGKEETLEDVKKDAKLEIIGYGDIKKIKVGKQTAAKIDETVKKYNDLIGTAKGDTNKKGLSSESSIDDCITSAKEAIDALVAAAEDKTDEDISAENTQPASTSDFIMVGGSWVTPQVSYGQYVNVVLPVVNMSQTDLVNVTVTPVISNSASEWPFVLDTSNYTQTIPSLPGKLNGQDDMDRRRELTWTFRARDDALSGYYKLQFNVLYANGADAESATLTTYVRVFGAPGIGNIETESSGTSTPRVIVTGFETIPNEVHAGDDFDLILHLKNTSRRTAVSNMLVNISSPSEGTDTDSSYAVFLPVSGSNSEYISYIGKGQETDLKISLSAKADLAQKPYQLDISMEYEDDEYASFSASADISIPIIQEARFEISTPEIMPSELQAGNEAGVMFYIYNLGKVTLHNVKVKFEGQSVSGGEAFIGKIEPGGTGNVDVMVMGEKASDQKPEVVITYEDDAGNISEFRQEVELKVVGEGYAGEEEAAYMFEDEDYESLEYEDDEEGGILRILIPIAIAAAVIAVIIIIAVLIKKSRAKKREKEDIELLDELEDEVSGEVKDAKESVFEPERESSEDRDEAD